MEDVNEWSKKTNLFNLEQIVVEVLEIREVDERIRLVIGANAGVTGELFSWEESQTNL